MDLCNQSSNNEVSFGNLTKNPSISSIRHIKPNSLSFLFPGALHCEEMYSGDQQARPVHQRSVPSVWR